MTNKEAIKAIKAAVDAGHDVQAGAGYHIIKDQLGQYLVVFEGNNYCVGLHGLPGTQYEHELNVPLEAVTVNGKPLI